LPVEAARRAKAIASKRSNSSRRDEKERTMEHDFGGKVAIVTGAASGLGRATAVAFAKRGASMVLADVDDSGGRQLANELTSSGARAVFLRTDVSSPADCERMVAAARESFGRLDIAYNNAGISDSATPPPTHEYPLELWHKIISIDLSGVFYCLRYEIPLMLAGGGGAIVNTASMQATKAYPGCPAYTAAKAGVIGLTRVVCSEYAGRGFRCNAIAPGVVLTPYSGKVLAHGDLKSMFESQIPAGRIGDADEVAHTVLWLCSPINGACLPVDGGFMVR
jgi:NAD(P)-dependent dehydrogenase (short-subunit alcohol dehydrogenase family)